MRIKVVTDCISTGGYFPAWYKYYANEFGANSLHVFCYPEIESNISDFPLGGLHRIDGVYQDDLRKATLTDFINSELRDTDIIIRVDVDEFLVPDPNRHRSLRDFIMTWNGRHITARGFDVFQTLKENELNFNQKILPQRSTCYALTALNKTCITRVSLIWGRGFHYCSLPPVFDDVYLFHLKRGDINQQISWNMKMIERGKEDAFLLNYYSWGVEEIRSYHFQRGNLPLLRGADVFNRMEFNRDFLSKIRFHKQDRLFNGPYEIEPVNLEIPENVRHFF